MTDTNLWETSQVQLPTQWFYLIVLVFFLIFHSSRLYFINKANKDNHQTYAKLWIFDVRHISYLVIIPPSLIMLQNVILYTSNLILNEPITNVTICTYQLRFSVIASGISKFAMFVTFLHCIICSCFLY